MQARERIEKLKSLVKDIDICLFCTNPKIGDGATTRPMSAQEVDGEDNLWFFSDIDSDKSKEVKMNKKVQLFFLNIQKIVIWLLTARLKLLLTKIKQQSYFRHWLKSGLKKARMIPIFLFLK